MLNETFDESYRQASLRSVPNRRGHAPRPDLLAFGAAVVTTLLCAACSSSSGMDAMGDGGADSGNPAPPVFLDPSDYADLVTIDPAFHFGVTARHEADDAIVGSHWGHNGGPMVTTGLFGGSAAPAVIEWSIPGDPKSKATSTSTHFATATGLPKTFYYGGDGMVDLPFGPFSLLAYSGSGTAYPGEALLYSASYDKVLSRARVNGFYSGAGVTDGTHESLIYSGLSPLSTQSSTVDDNGLYAASICGGALGAPPPCPASSKILSWTGNSGPVIADAHGNVFVAASLVHASTTDRVYGLSRAQALAGKANAAVDVADADSKGTSSLAAVAPSGSDEGWVLGIGFDATSKLYAAGYTETSSAIAKGSKVIEKAVAPASGVSGLSAFTDTNGDLWLAVTTKKTGFYLELRRKP